MGHVRKHICERFTKLYIHPTFICNILFLFWLLCICRVIKVAILTRNGHISIN